MMLSVFELRSWRLIRLAWVREVGCHHLEDVVDELLVRLGHVARVEALLEVEVEHGLLHVLRALLQACRQHTLIHSGREEVSERICARLLVCEGMRAKA